MPTDDHYTLATFHLDKAAETVRRIGDGAPVEAVAQVGVGYALLALMDEVEKGVRLSQPDVVDRTMPPR